MRKRTAIGWFAALGLLWAALGALAESPPPILENSALKITLSLTNASLTVLDKRDQFVWRQEAQAGLRVDPSSLRVTSGSLGFKVVGEVESYEITLALAADSPQGFDLTVSIPKRNYTRLPAYPFPFTGSGKDWSYVQNTSGEGVLMPLDKSAEIFKPFGWSGGLPWWGLTDLRRAMSARLETFRNADTRPSPEDATVYALPMRIHYGFFAEGGYVALAQDYRAAFLRARPELEPLRQRVPARPTLAGLKEGVYVYLWGKNPAEDLKLVTEMQEAGIEHGIAVFYGRHPVDRALFDGIKHLGWVAGVYRMPTGNLARVSKRRGWPNDLLLGNLDPDRFRARAHAEAWDRICARQILPKWIEKAKALIRAPGIQLGYFDTLVGQLAPCLDPDHPSTIEENQQARLEIMQQSRALGLIVGSGEGLSPAWAIPGVDFFEGEMSLRTYADPHLRIPAGEYEKDNSSSYGRDAAIILDETRRIPLYQLAFHDYVVGTWVWRDTNFQSLAFAHRKDLFNILYGTMPMWHINRALWEAHKADYVASYRQIARVRSRVGFAAMTDHGWLSPDRSVQFTDWDTGDRVIVNFGKRPYERAGKPAIAPEGFTIEKK